MAMDDNIIGNTAQNTGANTGNLIGGGVADGGGFTSAIESATPSTYPVSPDAYAQTKLALEKDTTPRLDVNQVAPNYRASDNFNMSYDDAYYLQRKKLAEVNKNADKANPYVVTNEDAYVRNNPIQIGTYTGSIIGSAPIFRTGGEGLFPVALFDKKRLQLQYKAQQALKDYLDPFDVATPKVNEQSAAWQESVTTNFNNGLKTFIDRANKYGVHGVELLKDPRTQLGSEFKRYTDNYNALTGEINKVTDTAAQLAKLEQEGFNIPKSAREAVSQIMTAHSDMTNGTFNNTVNLKEKINILDRAKSMTTVAKDVFASLQQRIDTEIKQDSSLKNASEGELALAIETKKSKYLTDGTFEALAKDVANAHPYDVYGEKSEKMGIRKTDAMTTTKELETYLKDMIQPQVEKANQFVNKSAASAKATALNAAGDEVKTTLSNAANNAPYNDGTKQIGLNTPLQADAKNYVIAGNGGVISVVDGVQKQVPFTDKLGIQRAVISVLGAKAGKAGVNADMSEAAISATLKNHPEYQAEIKRLTEKGTQSVDVYKKAATGDFITQGNATASTFGAIHLGDQLNILNLNSHSNTTDKGENFDVQANVGGIVQNGIPINIKSLSNATSTFDKSLFNTGYFATSTSDGNPVISTGEGDYGFASGYSYVLDSDKTGKYYKAVNQNGHELKIQDPSGKGSDVVAKFNVKDVQGLFTEQFKQTKALIDNKEHGNLNNGLQVSPKVAGKENIVSSHQDPVYENIGKSWNGENFGDNTAIAKAFAWWASLNPEIAKNPSKYYKDFLPLYHADEANFLKTSAKLTSKETKKIFK